MIITFGDDEWVSCEEKPLVSDYYVISVVWLELNIVMSRVRLDWRFAFNFLTIRLFLNLIITNGRLNDWILIKLNLHLILSFGKV